MRPLLAAIAALALVLDGCGSAKRKEADAGPPGPTGPTGPTGPPVDPIPAGDWPIFRRDCAGTSLAPAALPAASAAKLSQRWSSTVGEATYAQAVVTGDRAFLTTANHGSVVAVDVASGAVRWSYDFDALLTATCAGRTYGPGTWGSAAVSNGVVYAASPDGGVYALDAATGAKKWRAAVASPEPDAELVQTAVVVSQPLGKAYVGVASVAHCDQIPGRVAAIDLATGAVTSRRLVPEGRRGAGVWAALAVDEAAHRVYAATGNAIGDPASEPYAQAIVALDATTLEPLDSWQNPTALQNADFGAAPTLFAGGGRSLVAAASKDGWLYVLDRAALSKGPVWKYPLAVTGNSDGLGGDPLQGFGAIAPAAFANGLLYAAGGRTPQGEPGAVVAFDPGTGAVAWKHATPGPVLQPMAVTAEVVAVVSAFDADGNAVLELLDAKSGARLASFTGNTGSLSAPSFGAGRVLWSTWDGQVRALAP